MQRLRGDLPSKAIECCDLKSKRIYTKKKKMHLVLLLIFPCLVGVALYSYRSKLEDIPLPWLQLLLHFDVPTVNIYALGNIKPDICRWVSLLLIRALLLFPLKNPFRPSTAFCVIFLWRTSKASRGNFHFPINLTEGRRGLWRFNLTQYVGSF